jgi:hypothetical protein
MEQLEQPEAAQDTVAYPPLQWVKAVLRSNQHARLSRRRHILGAYVVGSEARGQPGRTLIWILR